jgi:hypothetical protein
MSDPHNIDDRKMKLMAFMDGELTPEETAEVNDFLRRDAALRAEYTELCRSCHRLDRLHFEMPSETELKKLWRNPLISSAYRFAWFLIVGSVTIIFGSAIYEVFINSGKFGFNLKTMIAAFVGGFIILLILTILKRVLTYSKDPYRDIEK